MIKLQWKLFLALTLAILMAGCKADNKLAQAEPEGTVRISNIGLDQTVAPTRLSTDDLSLRIENTRGEVLRTWERIADVPSQIRVVAGSYKLVAWSGDTSLMPSFVDMYYEGSEKFTVAAGGEVSVALTVKLGVSKVKVEFDEATFADQYSAFSADLRTTTPSNPEARLLNFMPTTTEEANFLPGTLRIRMRLTSKLDGKEYIFYPSPITGLNAAEARTVTLKVVTTTGKNSLLVTTDSGYAKEEEITLMLPGSALPKPAPVVRPNGFVVGGTIEGTEGDIPSTLLSATLLAQGGLKSVKIRTTSEAVAAMWGGRNEIEIVDADTEVLNLLTSSGIEWDNALNTSATANVKYGRSEISFAGLYGALAAEAGAEYTDYPFEIEAVDMFNQSNKNLSTGAGRFNFTVRVNKPYFGWAATPNAGNVWSSHAEFDIQYKSNTAKVPRIWIKEGDGAWVSPATQEFMGVTGDPTIGVQTIKGLKAATQYSFKLMMGAHSTDELTVVTESLETVENGDMETWQGENLSTSPHKIPYYQPYARGGNQHWTTNNDRTTSHRAALVTYGYNSFPAVSYTTSMARTGKYAAELRNTSASDIDGLNTTNITQSHSQVPGMLFIGTFSYEKPNDVVKYGKPFASRPAKMTFYHTYAPYGSDKFIAEVILYSAGVEIGRGSYVSGEAVASYTETTVEVTYSDRRHRADAMAIAFSSSVSRPAEVRKVNGSVALDMEGNMDYNKNWSAFIGSILRVDDIAVGY